MLILLVLSKNENNSSFQRSIIYKQLTYIMARSKVFIKST